MRRILGAVVLAGLLAGATALGADPVRVARLGSDRLRQRERVEVMTYSPDGKHLITADGDSLHVWDAADGKRIRTIPVENHEFFALRYTPDGKTLYAGAVAGGLTRLCRIDPAAGKVLVTSHLLTGPATGVFSPDGKWLAVLFDNGEQFKVFDTATNVSSVAVKSTDHPHQSVAFRGDGKVLAIGTKTRRITVLDPATGKGLHEITLAGGGAVRQLAYSPDGTDIVAEIAEPTHVARIEVATGRVRWTKHLSRAEHVTFTADGKRVLYFGAAGPGRTELDQWRWLDATTGDATGDVMDTRAGHSVALRPDEKVLAIGGHRGHITQWDLTTRTCLHDASAEPPEPVTDLRYSSDGKTVRGWSRGWYEWDVKSGKQTRLTPRLDIGSSVPFAVSHDQKWLVRPGPTVFGDLGSLRLIDLTGGRPERLIPSTADVAASRFLPDGRLLAVALEHLTVLDLATGVASHSLSRAERQVPLVAANGTVIALVAVGPDGLTVDIWDRTSGKLKARWATTLARHGGRERLDRWTGAVSADGRRILLAFHYVQDRYALPMRSAVFETATGRKLGEWVAVLHTTPVFSPDGRTVACYSDTPSGVELREAMTGEKRVGSFGRSVQACAFAADGRSLALSTIPGPVEVWDPVGPVEPWDPKRTDDLWHFLQSDTGELPHAAVRLLQAHPAEAVALLKDRVKVPVGPTAAWVAARIADLDSGNFRVREQSMKDLGAQGEIVSVELRVALRTASAEARERLLILIPKAEAQTAEQRRAVRACEVLEGIGTPAARELLTTWAKGPVGATLVREATESLERLKGRS